MADAEARFVIAIDQGPGVAGANAVGSALDRLKDKITKGTKALQELQASAARLKNAGDVVRFERVGKDLQRAQADAEKLTSKISGLREKLEQTTDIKTGQKLKMQLDEVTKALHGAQTRVAVTGRERDALGQSDAVKAYKDVTAAIKEKQAALAEAQTELSRLGGSLTESGAASGKASGFFGGLKARLEGVTKSAGFARVALVAGAVAALFAIAAAGAVATYSLGKFVLELSDAARTSRIFADATARSAEGGAALLESVNRVYQRVGGAKGEIQQLALELRRVGIEGQNLESSIEAVSAATRVFGQQSGSALKGFIDRAALAKRGFLSPLELRGTGLAFDDVASAVANRMKVSMATASAALTNGRLKVEDFTAALRDATRARTGQALEKLALSLPDQFERAKNNLAQIFSVKPDGFLRGLKTVLDLLDESTETGQKFRAISKAIFQPIMNSAETVFPIVRALVLGAALGLFNFAIYVLDAAIALKDMLPAGLFDSFDLVNTAFQIGEALAIAFGVAVTAIATAVAACVAQLYLLGKALGLVWDLGSWVVKGIAKAIGEESPQYQLAMRRLAEDGHKAFEQANEIHSPSELFRRTARHIPEGAAMGIEDEAPQVSGAVAALASPTALEEGAAAGGLSSGAGGGARSITVNIDARGSSAGEVKANRDLYRALVEILKDALREAGGSPTMIGSVTVST